MQNIKAHILVLLCLALTTNCLGQQHTKPISLQYLLDRVNQNAPALFADSAAIGIRQAQAAEARNNWLPDLKLNYQADIGTNNNTAGPYFGFGIVPGNSRGVRPESNTNAVLTNLGIAALNWEIYNFGAYAAQNKVADSDIAVEQYQFQRSKYRLQAYTIAYYLQLLRLQDHLNIQARNIERDQQIRRSIQSLAKSGVRPGVDTSIAEAELSKARLTYIELSDQLKQTQLQLASISGVPYQSIVADSLAETRLIGLTNASQLDKIDTTDHPVINYYRSVVNNSRQKEALVKKQYNPKIMLEAAVWGRGASIDGNDHYNSLSSGWGFDRNNYLVGVGVSYNLFDLRRKQLKLHTQKAATDYALRKLDEQKNLLALSVDQAEVEVSTARQRLAEIPNQLKAATAGYRQKLSLYKSGLTDIIELNAALNILYRAETDHAQARFAYISALFQRAVAGNDLGSVLNLLN